MRSKAIVFGCTGQDGAYLCNSLLEKNYEVIGTSRKKSPNLKRLVTLGVEEKIKIICCDLENYQQTKHTIETFQPTEIYNLSAQSSVGNSFIRPIETQKSIVNATINILESCREINFKGNIFLTTQDFQFANSVGNRVIELGTKGFIDKLMSFGEYLNDPKVKEQREIIY